MKKYVISPFKLFVVTAVLALLTGCLDDGKDGVDGLDGANGIDGMDGQNAQQIGTLGSGPVVINGISNTAPDESIYVRKIGNGDNTIVLLPGNNSSGLIFDGMLNLFRAVDALNDQYTVYTFDYRGSGQSSYNEKITSLGVFANDFEEVMLSIDDFPTENVTLVGYSMGFAVALEMTILNPSRYSKLVGIAPVGTRGVRVIFDANTAGTDSLGNVWQAGDAASISDDTAGIVATAFQQRSWQGENRTFNNVQFTWDLVVFNDILKINPLDFSMGEEAFKSQPNYMSTINDVLNVQYMPESLYYTHKFNVSSLSGGSFSNSSGETVEISGDDRLASSMVGIDVLLIKAETDYLNWRGDLVITDNIIASTKYDLKQAGANTTAVLIDADYGYDHGLAVAKSANLVNVIDAFVNDSLTSELLEELLDAPVQWFENDETEFESAEY